ncbi:serine/threonine protein kinase [Actinoplanes sp. CA-030573]|uniref:serine/threonine protein kinase n=1 Tax=Actinoplanes sp. CA-030573 TaxID=3239898 RepID=UPI003D90FFB7
MQIPPLPEGLDLLELKLGAVGRNSTIFSGKDSTDGAIVALKVFKEKAKDEHRREIFERHAAALTRLTHPNIARLRRSGFTLDHYPFHLSEISKSNSTEVTTILSSWTGNYAELGSRLAAALAHAHDLNVVHGAVTPGNVLIAPTGPVLIDFQPPLACGINKHGPDLAFDPPEFMWAVPPSPASDIYQLCATLTWLISHRPARTVQPNVSLAELHDAYVAPLEDWPGVAPNMVKILQLGLSFEPASRPSIGDIAAKLSQTVDATGTAAHRRLLIGGLEPLAKQPGAEAPIRRDAATERAASVDGSGAVDAVANVHSGERPDAAAAEPSDQGHAVELAADPPLRENGQAIPTEVSDVTRSESSVQPQAQTAPATPQRPKGSVAAKDILKGDAAETAILGQPGPQDISRRRRIRRLGVVAAVVMALSLLSLVLWPPTQDASPRSSGSVSPATPPPSSNRVDPAVAPPRSPSTLPVTAPTSRTPQWRPRPRTSEAARSEPRKTQGERNSLVKSTPPARLRWESERLPSHLVGRLDGDGWSATVKDGPGFLSYGPYTTKVTAGSHAGSVALAIDNNTADDAVVATLDVFDSTAGMRLAVRQVHRNDFTRPNHYQVFTLPFSIAKGTAGHMLEIRTWTNSLAYLRQDWQGFS